ncbi:hypothetical protein CR513_58666, partial [Mucuna pruriens]
MTYKVLRDSVFALARVQINSRTKTIGIFIYCGTGMGNFARLRCFFSLDKGSSSFGSYWAGHKGSGFRPSGQPGANPAGHLAHESDSEGFPSWIDPRVFEVYSVYTSPDSLAALRALNVARTQLHPNSWTFLQAFELLCEDMGQEPSLSVFSWFFSLRRAKKPAISITVGKQLESWEKEFIVELDQLPTLSCSKLISPKGYSTKDIAVMKACPSRFTTPGVVEASLLSAAPPAEEEAPMVPMVVLESVGESPPLTVEEIGRSAKWATEGGALRGKQRPSKQVKGGANFNFSTLVGFGRLEVDDS